MTVDIYFIRSVKKQMTLNVLMNIKLCKFFEVNPFWKINSLVSKYKIGF